MSWPFSSQILLAHFEQKFYFALFLMYFLAPHALFFSSPPRLAAVGTYLSCNGCCACLSCGYRYYYCRWNGGAAAAVVAAVVAVAAVATAAGNAREAWAASATDAAAAGGAYATVPCGVWPSCGRPSCRAAGASPLGPSSPR